MFKWLGRIALVFVALVAAIMLYQSTKPSFEGFLELRQTASALSSGERVLRRESASAISRSNADVAGFQGLTRRQIDSRIAAAQKARVPIARACGSDLAALVTKGAKGVIDNRKQCLRETLLAREIATLAAIRSSLDARRSRETMPQALRRHAATMHRASEVMRDARAKLRTLDNDYVPDFLQGTAMGEQRTRIARAERYYVRAQRNVKLLRATQFSMARASQTASNRLDSAHAKYRQLVDARAKALSNSVIEKAKAWAEANGLFSAMKAAAIMLALIIASPFLIRLICYFVLAPAAMRRPSIRLPFPDGEAGIPISPSRPSTTSLEVQLLPAEELLVRHDYLQTTSCASTAGTQWFLDWRHPLTSIATGLTFLTRVRGEGEVTSVSAVHDPFAEVTVLTLPMGSACVLQPRAIAAVAQPIQSPLRVRGHWRILSLSAWLTMQLRYLVFHGPARLIVKGARGVRVERAEKGRIFAQRQLVGFSADLSYSVTRTQTFWPYFFGREDLIKDRVEGGEGVLIIEEAPMAGRSAGKGARGIEGLLDAGMKVFGL